MDAFLERERRGGPIWLRVLVTVGAAALALSAAACGGGGGGGGSGVNAALTGGTPVKGGTATYALPPSAAPDYIFPFTSASHFSVVNRQYFQYLMYRPLYWFGNGNSPTLNENLSLAHAPVYHGTTVTISLKGWKWSNGQAISAGNVLFWIHMMQAVGGQDWGDYAPGGFPSNVSNVRAVSATEVTMTMNRAYNPAWFTDNELSQITPMPAAWDRTAAGASDCTTTVSDCAAVYRYLDAQSKARSGWASSRLWGVVDGPWRLAGAGSDGRTTFVPNPRYSGSPRPRLDKFQEVPFATEAAEYRTLRAGAAGRGQRVDVGYLPIPDAPRKPAGAAAGTSPVTGYTLVPLYSWSLNYFPVNFHSTTGNGPVIRQAYFRRALQYLLNQKAVIDGPLKGYGNYTAGPVGTNPPAGYLSSRGRRGDPFPYNPAKARELLSGHGWTVVPNGVSTCAQPRLCGAGVKRGQKLTFTLPYATGTDWIAPEMTQLRSSAALAGIRLTLDPKPSDQVTALAGSNCVVARTSCDWDMGNWGGGWTFGPDYYPSGETLFLSGSRANSGGYSDARNDELINQTLTSSAATPLNQWQDYLSAQVPVIWQPNGAYELSEIRNTIRGVVPQSTTLNLNPENWYFVK